MRSSDQDSKPIIGQHEPLLTNPPLNPHCISHMQQPEVLPSTERPVSVGMTLAPGEDSHSDVTVSTMKRPLPLPSPHLSAGPAGRRRRRAATWWGRSSSVKQAKTPCNTSTGPVELSLDSGCRSTGNTTCQDLGGVLRVEVLCEVRGHTVRCTAKMLTYTTRGGEIRYETAAVVTACRHMPPCQRQAWRSTRCFMLELLVRTQRLLRLL